MPHETVTSLDWEASRMDHQQSGNIDAVYSGPYRLHEAVARIMYTLSPLTDLH